MRVAEEQLHNSPGSGPIVTSATINHCYDSNPCYDMRSDSNHCIGGCVLVARRMQMYTYNLAAMQSSITRW
jgi:hypothetical protein